MKLRNALETELPQIAALYRSAIGTPGCTWNDEYPGTFELIHDFEGGNLYVLTRDDQVIGAVSVVSPNELDDFDCWQVRAGSQKEIARVVVSRDYAGQGIAVTMLRLLFEKLNREGCGAIHLSVAKCNPAAIRTYRKLGFAFLGACEMYGHSYYLCELIL